MSVIRVQSLGASEIQIVRKRITLSTEVMFALAFYLCMRAGERITRDEVVETFWGSRDVTRGRHSLRQMLYRLREKGLALDEEGEDLFLDPARVECDATRALEETWPESADASAIEATGEFLTGFSREISPRFQEWLDELRARLALQFRRAALRQIGQARREGRWGDIERWAHLVLESDPLNEEATMARAESAAMAGSKTMALEILDTYVEELGERAPQIGLPATVLRRRIAERRPEWGLRGPREVAMVGRQDLMMRMTGMLESAGAGVGCAVELSGAPGVGKTRVAHEALLYAELVGFRTLRTRVTLSHESRPLSALLAIVPLLRDLPGALGSHPSSLAILARASNNQTLISEADPPSSASVPSHVVLEALHDLLAAVSGEVRLAILIDDLHNVDSTSRAVLDLLVARTTSCRIFWIATTRPQAANSDRPHSTATQLRVAPLDVEESTALAESVSDLENRCLTRIELVRIARAAAGNPLFVRELSLDHSRRSRSDTLPSSLVALMNDRLGKIDGPRTRLLRVIALLGGLSTVARVRRIHGAAPAEISSAIEALEDEGMLHLSATRTLELHDCWLQAITARLSPAARATLSHECAGVLDAEAESSSDSEIAWQAAELFANAGDLTRAVPLFCGVGDQMFSRGLVSEAAIIYQRALGLSVGARSTLDLRARLARAFHTSAQLELVESTCTEALKDYRYSHQEEHSAAVRLACLRLDCLVKLKKDHRADLALVAEFASDARVPDETRQLACFTGIAVVFNDRSSALEDQFFRISQQIAASAGASTVSGLVALMYAAERGLAEEVSATEALLERLESDTVSDELRCRALRIRATAQRWTGHAEEAFLLGERAFTHARARGLLGEVVIVAEMMTYTALDAANTEQTALWSTRWADAHPQNADPERIHARSHARCRVLVNEGRFAEAAAIYDDASMRWDFLAKRRAADVAALAHCWVNLGMKEEARVAISETIRLVAESRPSPQMDYVIEMILRSLTSLGDTQLLAQTVRAYTTRRSVEFPFPVAGYFSTLAAAVATSPRI